MEYAGGCEKATLLDFSKPLNIDLKADQDVWYRVDMKAIDKLGDKLIPFSINNPSGKAVEFEIEVTPTCPLLVSVIKTITIKAEDGLKGAIPASMIMDAYDQVIAQFNLPKKIENNLPGKFYEYYVRVRANGDLSIEEGEDAPEVIEHGCDKATLLDITKPIVALACGSISITNTLNFFKAKAAAKLIVVVVLPTPPFWLEIAIILPILFSL